MIKNLFQDDFRQRRGFSRSTNVALVPKIKLIHFRQRKPKDFTVASVECLCFGGRDPSLDNNIARSSSTRDSFS
jgi:hypothetical protein